MQSVEVDFVLNDRRSNLFRTQNHKHCFPWVALQAAHSNQLRIDLEEPFNIKEQSLEVQPGRKRNAV